MKITFDQKNVDKFTEYLVAIASDHTYIHQGIGFELSSTTGSLAAGATYAVALVAPTSGKFVHLRPAGISSTANTLQMRFAEGSIVTGGTPVTPRNKNRNSKNTSAVTATVGVTISTEGTILEYAQVGGGSNAANATGGSGDGSANEWVLRPGRTYTMRFENVGSTTATVGYFNVFWYEEEAGS